MLVKIEALILIFPGTNFHFPSTSVPPGTFFRLCRLVTFIWPPIYLLTLIIDAVCIYSTCVCDSGVCIYKQVCIGAR